MPDLIVFLVFLTVLSGLMAYIFWPRSSIVMLPPAATPDDSDKPSASDRR